MSGIFLLLNDSNHLISYDGPWKSESSDHEGSHCLDAGEGGSISVTFNGTSIAFAGNTPDVPNAKQFKVSIDDEMPEDASYLDENHYERWYQSPLLPDGIHTINLSGLVKGTDLDYVLIEAGPSTPLANSTILVDDNSTEIRYSAGWNRNNNSLDDANGVLYSFFGGATMESATENVSFSFEFAGTAVYVYGIHKAVEGTGAVRFSVDDSAPLFALLDPPMKKEDTVNHLFFKNDELEPGNHTLMCNVTQVTGDQFFALDYIIYTPSFESLSDDPYFVHQPQASASTLSPSSQSEDSASDSVMPTGAIAGVVAGAIVLLVVVLTLSVVWYRGRKQRVVLSRSSSFGDATIASGGLSPPEPSLYDTEAVEARTPLVPNRFDPNLFVSNNMRSEKYAPSSRRLSLSSRFRDFGIGWGYSKRTSSYPEKF